MYWSVKCDQTEEALNNREKRLSREYKDFRNVASRILIGEDNIELAYKKFDVEGFFVEVGGKEYWVSLEGELCTTKGRLSWRQHGVEGHPKARAARILSWPVHRVEHATRYPVWVINPDMTFEPQILDGVLKQLRQGVISRESKMRYNGLREIDELAGACVRLPESW